MGIRIQSGPQKARPREKKSEAGAAAVYEAIAAELAGLDVGERFALVQVLDDGAPWSELSEETREIFRALSGRLGL